MALSLIYKKLKSFLLFFVTIWKRALCCFRRRRRSSEFVPLTQIGVVSNQNIESTQENWSDWNDQGLPNFKPTTIQEHIEFYRQQAIAARQAQEETKDVQENLFEDMTPTITKQTKLYLNSKNDDNGYALNRLSLDPEGVHVQLGQELGEWEDCSGWEDQTLEWDAREALKESRKQARQKKIWEQQQRRQDKFIRPVLGAKVSS